MVTTSLRRTPASASTPGAPVYPASPATGTYQGETYPDLRGADRRRDAEPHAGQEGPRTRARSWIRPTRPQTPIVWQGALADPPAVVDVRPEARATSATVWSQLNFPRLLFNTAAIAILSTLGAVLSSALVAYGFARFRFPGKNILFIILIATIILPFQVTLIPTYVIFTKLGWNGTWLPLIVPHFFANAFNVFLLRQYFLSIPRDLDEAAMIDGASPFRILRSVILPLSVPAIDGGHPVPLLLLVERLLPAAAVPVGQAGPPDAVDRDPAVQRAVRRRSRRSIQAAALMTMAVPVVVFFLAQRAFMRGVVVTGVEK